MKIPFRIKYFLSHLLISAIVAGFCLFLIFGIWFKYPLNIALGVGQIVILMLVIDVILGPLLTLIITKEGKKTLKFDLAVIAILQISALCYGLYSIDKGRPIWLSFDVNGFDVIQKHMITQKDGDTIAPEYSGLNWMGAKWVYTTPAKDSAELQERIKDDFEHGIVASSRPALYQPIDKGIDDVFDKAKPISDLNYRNKPADVQKALKNHPQADKYLPMRASAANMAVLLSSQTKQIVAIVDLRP